MPEIKINGIYATEDIITNEKVVRFMGRICSEKLLDTQRTEHPDDFYRDIGKMVIDQFNNEKNWV